MAGVGGRAWAEFPESGSLFAFSLPCRRDRDIEAVQTMIRNCAAAGIPCLKYNMSILGVLRTGRAPGRGDTSYSSFRLADARPDPPLTRAGLVSPDMYWERIVYFLEKVIPVGSTVIISVTFPSSSVFVTSTGSLGTLLVESHAR